MPPAITARGLRKRYVLGAGTHTSLRDQISAWAGGAREERDEVWALKGVDLDIAQGETVGIVGANGSGKSTLLKILSRITDPTDGWAEVHGRLGSLLEVGTGFHPDLTGRENVFLNGAILGMSRAEIRARFDRIVEFSGVERFLDTPVKRYSSGMYLRLAFAVAAHLEPEVIVVDEVLAVGDAAFQKRCIARMRELADDGRTVILVSHDMGTVSRLCRTAVWLDSGRVAMAGPTATVLAPYESAGVGAADRVVITPKGVPISDVAVRLEDDAGAPNPSPMRTDPLTFALRLTAGAPLHALDAAFAVREAGGAVVFDETLSDGQGVGHDLDEGSHALRCRVEPVLSAGSYTAELWLRADGHDIYHGPVFGFEVRSAPDDLDEQRTRSRVVHPPTRWTVEGD